MVVVVVIKQFYVHFEEHRIRKFVETETLMLQTLKSHDRKQLILHSFVVSGQQATRTDAS